MWNLPKVKSKLDGKKKLGRLKAGGRKQLNQFSILPANVSDWPHTCWQVGSYFMNATAPKPHGGHIAST